MFTPFRGLVFDTAIVPAPGSATSPPYDVIDEVERREYLAASPYNVVRLLLAEPDDPEYSRAASWLEGWQDAGVLRRDPSERLYLYEMDFRDDEGTEHRAYGVMGALAVEELGARVVGHEETMSHTKADRMAVLEATFANLDPIVALSPAPELAALLKPTGSARLDFTAAGVRHRLYDIVDESRIAAIQAAIGAHPVAIADGHHRYTTAIGFRAQQHATTGAGRWDAIMAFVAPASGSGLRIDPIHRAFGRVGRIDAGALDAAFESAAAPARAPAPGEIVLHLGAEHESPPRLLRPRAGTLATLPGPWRAAGSAVARETLYPILGVDEADATYFPSAERAVEWLEGHPKGMVAEVAAVSEEAIAEASEAGLRFPQKTTFFMPKPRAGLVLRSLKP